MNWVTGWLQRNLSDPQVVILAVFLILGFSVILFMGDMLTPVLASIVIAYLLESIARKLEQLGTPRLIAVFIVFLLFLALLFFVLFALIPALSTQITQLVQQFPSMIARGHELLLRLPELYPNFVTERQVNEMIASLQKEFASLGQVVLSHSLTSVVGLITLLVYLVLMPLLVFFFLKDKQKILLWFRGHLPADTSLVNRVWRDVDLQIGNYVRGKVWEILIVWSASFVVFSLMGLQFAMLLGALVGLSVIIPYIGAVVVTIPVALIAYFQWGWSADFAYLLLAYGIIQAVDGNIIVPLLFSEVVNLHPVAIVVAVLVFGGFWGFWGVFFAIPLATLVQAVLAAWPKEAVTSC